MTLAISGPLQTGAAPQRTVSVLAQPGFMERAMVVMTTFVFLHSTPNIWFRTRSESLADGSNPLLVLLILGLIGLAFIRVAGSIDHLITMVRLESAIFIFAGMTFASVFWSVNPIETMEKSVVFIAVTLYGSYLVLRFSLDQIIRLLAVMFVISAAINTAFIVAFPRFGIDSGDRLTGVFSQKNALGYTAALAIPTLVIAAIAYRPARIAFFPCALVHIGLLLGSQSKTMLVATAAPTLLMGVYQLFRSRKTLRGAVMLSLAGSGLFAVAFATANIALLATWLDKDVSLTGRVPLWENLLPIAFERPLTGHGYGATFTGYFSPVHEVWIQNQWNPSHAHNALLQIWLEIGVLGVIFFGAIYLRGVSRAIKVVAIVPGAVGLWPLVFLTTTLMVSITESGVTSDFLGWMMLVVTALSVSMHLRHRDHVGLSNDLRLATEANAKRARDA